MSSDKLSKSKLRYLILGFITVTALSAVTGFMIGQSVYSLENENSAEFVSETEARDAAQSFLDQRVESQKQQLDQISEQNENISRSDLSINGRLDKVTKSRFGSLYSVNISLKGTTASRTGELQNFNQKEEIYISKDGKSLFQEPINIGELEKD